MLRTENLRVDGEHLRQVDGFLKLGNNLGFSLDGSNDYFNIINANQTGLHAAHTNWTVEVLFRTQTSFAGDDTLAARWDGVTANSAYRLRINSTGFVVFEVSDGSTEESVTYATALTASTSYVAKASFSGTGGNSILRLRVYTDETTLLGAEATFTSTHSSLDNTAGTDTTIGAEDSGSDFFHGAISYVRMQDAEDTSAPSFALGSDVQGLWRGTLDATPELLDHSDPTGSSQNLNHMTANSLTSSDESSSVGRFMSPLLGVPSQVDLFKLSDGTELALINTFTRHYQFNGATDVWVDRTGATNLAGVAATGSHGGNFIDGTDKNVFVITNNVDQIKVRKTSGDSLGNLSSSLGATYLAKIYRSWGFRGNLYNITSGGTGFPTRHQWSSQNQIGDGDWDTTNDAQDLRDQPGAIIQCLDMRDAMLIYKERGAILAQALSGQFAPVWIYRTLYNGSFGLDAPMSLQKIDKGRHMYVGLGDVFIFDGNEPIGVGAKVFNEISNLIDSNLVKNAWAAYNNVWEQYHLFFPVSGDTYPATKWIYDIKKQAWFGPIPLSAMSKEFSAGGVISISSNPTWDDLTGSWAAQTWTWDTVTAEYPVRLTCRSDGIVYRGDVNTADWDGTDIDTRIDLPEVGFTERQSDGSTVRSMGRWQEVEVEGSFGSGTTLTLSTSVDEGSTWTSRGSPVSATFDSTVRRYVWYMDFIADKVRARVIKTGTATSSTFNRGRISGIPLEKY